MPTMPRDKLIQKLDGAGRSFFVVNFYAGYFCHKHRGVRIDKSVFVGSDKYTTSSLRTQRSNMNSIFKANAECTALDLCIESNPEKLEKQQELGVKGETIVAMAKAIKMIYCR